jgi:hypothetical protein
MHTSQSTISKETEHLCNVSCAKDCRFRFAIEKPKLASTEQIFAPHQCTPNCETDCTLKGTHCLQWRHSLSVVVTNIPQSHDRKKETWSMIKDHFSSCGRILAIRTAENKTDLSAIDAMVTFNDKQAAEKALQFNNTIFHERIISVHSALNVETSHLDNLPDISWGLGSPVVALGATAHSLGEQIHHLGDRMNAFDEYYQISENVQAVREGIREIDEQYHISETAAHVASQASEEGKKILHNVSEQVGLPQAKEAVITKATQVSEQLGLPEAKEALASSATSVSDTLQEIGEYLSSAFESVINFVSPPEQKEGQNQDATLKQPQA